VCNSSKRIIVMDEPFEPFVADLTRLATGLSPGHPRELAGTSYAPMSSRAAAENVATLVEDAVSKGATLHAGGELADGQAAYFSPAVLTGVSREGGRRDPGTAVCPGYVGTPTSGRRLSGSRRSSHCACAEAHGGGGRGPAHNA
jgi:hypothetical protein